MRDDDGQCGTCRPFIDCVACIESEDTETLHTCGKAVSFPAEADTVASSPESIRKKTLPPISE